MNQPPVIRTGKAEEKAEGGVPPSPIHPLAAVMLLVIDNLWNLADWAALLWTITIPLSFLSVFVPTFLVQRFLKNDAVGRALALAVVLGVLAAVPTSITGTPAGLALLAWAGLNRLTGKK
ncbi:MAG: hypothetical protein H0X66_12285 [Verrucomicrobia bacterium]|nr:hypothetical protein [Verrucomicrobiota bacterium]